MTTRPEQADGPCELLRGYVNHHCRNDVLPAESGRWLARAILDLDDRVKAIESDPASPSPAEQPAGGEHEAHGMSALLNAPIQFGLIAQGHIPTIERMLDDGKDWGEISAAIGWEKVTTLVHYVHCLRSEIRRLTAAASPQGSELPTEPGVWFKDGREFLVHRVHGDNRLGVYVLDADGYTVFSPMTNWSIGHWHRVPPEPAEVAALRQQLAEARAELQKHLDFEASIDVVAVSKIGDLEAALAASRERERVLRSEADSLEKNFNDTLADYSAVNADRNKLVAGLEELSEQWNREAERLFAAKEGDQTFRVIQTCRAMDFRMHAQEVSDLLAALAANPAGQGESATQPAAAGGGDGEA